MNQQKQRQPRPTQKDIDLSFFALDILSGKTNAADITAKLKLYTRMKQYISDVAKSSDEYERAIKKAADICGI